MPYEDLDGSETDAAPAGCFVASVVSLLMWAAVVMLFVWAWRGVF